MDMRPLKFEGQFLWHPQPADAPDERQYDYLPQDAFDRLDGFIPRDNPRVNKMVKAYETEMAAMHALDRALLALKLEHEWRRACRHERLNEEGVCRACGADCRGIG